MLADPRAGAEQVFERVQSGVKALPGIETILCHKPWGKYTLGERAGGAARLTRAPWGAVMTWYSPTGLRRAVSLLSQADCPADWIWRDFCSMGTLAMLDPPVASHEPSGATYIETRHRGVRRRFIP